MAERDLQKKTVLMFSLKFLVFPRCRPVLHLPWFPPKYSITCTVHEQSDVPCELPVGVSVAAVEQGFSFLL